MGYGDGAFIAQRSEDVMAKWVIVFGRYTRKHWSFRGVPFLVITWLRVLVPLNSWPMAYYRKGGTTPHLSLRLDLRSPTLGWHSQCYEYSNYLVVGLNGSDERTIDNIYHSCRVLWKPWRAIPYCHSAVLPFCHSGICHCITCDLGIFWQLVLVLQVFW